MTDKPEKDPTAPPSFPSGPEVVSDFIEVMKGQEDLDQNTVLVIAKLLSDKKLSAVNLVKGLEEQRRQQKKQS